MKDFELIKKIKKLKKEKDVLFLAHYYQDSKIQELADHVGDSYQLSVLASKATESIILFCGVHFMGETAKILNPSKKVIVPDLEAGCSLASSCKIEDFSKFKTLYPNAIVVSYINCSAEIKAISDYICTSSNAEEIISNIPNSKEIIFAPDKNLGNYLIKKTGRKMILWDGVCIVHDAFSFNKILKIFNDNPGAKIVAHPESDRQVIEIAHFVGSTSKMINYIKTSDSKIFIVATEVGILHKLNQEVNDKIIIPAPVMEDNTCSCSECAFMKLNTLEKIAFSLENELFEIKLSDNLIKKAKVPLERMIGICESKDVKNV
jgi:quinolinate synthase